jgi:6-phosphogluconate dehydrogenase
MGEAARSGTNQARAQADIGVTGLSTMGRNLARNLARHGYSVALHNRTQSRTTDLVAKFGPEGMFVPSTGLGEFVGSLRRPRTVLILVKAGAATDAVIDDLAKLMEAGDIVVDCGNAHFMDTRRREAALREQGLHFVGAGVSGGEEGALHGPSIMVGGSAESYDRLGPMLRAIAAQVDEEPCCAHLGTDGAGHFVKMVHNGIEYSDMQLIAEAYDLLRQGTGASPAELAQVFQEWNRGELESYLIQITAAVLGHVDPVTGAPFVDVVADRAEQKGTGRWTVQTALELGVPVTGIAEAVFARSLSALTDERAAVRSLPGPDRQTRPAPTDHDLVADVRRALYASKIVAYAQGFDQIAAASAEYGWDIDRSVVASIWRGGCIIRARFLDSLRTAYRTEPVPATLLADPTFGEALAEAQDPWRRVVATAASIGVPTPGFASALAYYDGLRREHLPAALIQGLRDYFGSHTYARIDRPGTFHTNWAGDAQEHAVEPAH